MTYSHIFYADDMDLTSRALCYFKRYANNIPLDDNSIVCPDCASMASTILIATVKRPGTKK